MTPFANDYYITYPEAYKFSDGSQIGQVKKSDGNSSNYRFFEIQPIKWIVLNYNYLPSQYGTGGDGTHTRLELLANDVLLGGIAPDEAMWENSTINAYLNGTFNIEAYKTENDSRKTASMIYNNIDNSDSNLATTGSNSNYPVIGSNPTTQKLYLLSYYEVVNSSSPYIINGIFGTNNVPVKDKRLVSASDYANAHQLFINATTGNSTWWLRSTNGSIIYRIGTPGDLTHDEALNATYIGTRPAMQTNKKPIKQTIYISFIGII